MIEISPEIKNSYTQASFLEIHMIQFRTHTTPDMLQEKR